MHGLCGIDDDVDQDLLQLTGIPSDERQEGVKVLDDFDIVKESLVFKEEEAVGNGPVDIRGLHLGFGLTSEFEEAFDNILASTGLLNDPS
jgi:hypothetical protein